MAYGLAVLAWVAAAARAARAGRLALGSDRGRIGDAADLGQWKLERDTYEKRAS